LFAGLTPEGFRLPYWSYGYVSGYGTPRLYTVEAVSLDRLS
jgi:hypothetical protein